MATPKPQQNGGELGRLWPHPVLPRSDRLLPPPLTTPELPLVPTAIPMSKMLKPIKIQ